MTASPPGLPDAFTDATVSAPPALTSGPRVAARGAIVVVASLVLGGLTSLAQGVLPDALLPLANSASGWTLLTALVLGWAALRAVPSAVFGAVSFVCLVLGYTIVSTLRGFYYSPVMWSAVALVAGPFVGVAVNWLRVVPWKAAVGAALLGGIGLGECIYGLTMVVETTGWFYWTLIGLVALALLAVVAVRRVRAVRLVATEFGLAFVVAAVFHLTFTALGSVSF